jgi:uncharacterized protein involved in response to NO
MLSISEPKKSNQQKDGLNNHPIWQLPFRSFFLLSSLTCVISLTLWFLHLNGWRVLNHSGLSAAVWHSHEMLFGFAATVAVGFILTAVQTWTHLPSIKGMQVIRLVLLWLSVRICFWLNNEWSLIIAILVQSIWWGLVIYHFSHLVFRAQNRRNYLFIPVLSIMAIINIVILCADLYDFNALALHLCKAIVLIFTLLMGLVGGRVIPFFTIRGTNNTKINSPVFIDYLLFIVSICGALFFILDYFYLLPLSSAGFIVCTGILHLVRMAFWQSHKTWATPLLWSLHIAYFFMALGLILLGLSHYSMGINFNNALHIITVGAIGLMIMSMMSRVSFGHTGRALILNPSVSLSFILICFAVIIRTLLPDLIAPLLAWNISALLWITANIIFINAYWSVLSQPRQ